MDKIYTLLDTPMQKIRTTLTAACLCLLFLSGCDSTFVDPFSNDSRFFTVYGYLDASSRINSVRVIPITRRAEVITSPGDPQASIDARVFLINTNNGIEIEWNHSLVRLSEDRWGHIFSSSQRIDQNTIYRLEVRRSDGTVTSAETHVPGVSTLNIIQDQQPTIDPVTGDVQQGVLIPGISNVWSIDFIYYMGGIDCIGTTPVPVPYGRSGFYNGEGWRFLANASQDLEGIFDGEAITRDAVLCAIGIEAQVPNDDWTLPKTQAGVDSLAFSNVPSNVENGLGFFGSVGSIQNSWNAAGALRAAL